MNLEDYIPNLNDICHTAGHTDKPLNKRDISSEKPNNIKIKVICDYKLLKEELAKPTEEDVNSYFGDDDG